jgi:hypothetical protein
MHIECSFTLSLAGGSAGEGRALSAADTATLPRGEC